MLVITVYFNVSTSTLKKTKTKIQIYVEENARLKIIKSSCKRQKTLPLVQVSKHESSSLLTAANRGRHVYSVRVVFL